MKKKVLVWVLAAVLLLSMVGCSAANVSSTNDQYVGMEPAAAAEAAAAETKDTASLSDIIRVPFGYLLDWLYMFTNNYGLALILFSLIIKLVLLPMSVNLSGAMKATVTGNAPAGSAGGADAQPMSHGRASVQRIRRLEGMASTP